MSRFRLGLAVICLSQVVFAVHEQAISAEGDSLAVLRQTIEQTGVDRGLCAFVSVDGPAAIHVLQTGRFVMHFWLEDVQQVEDLRAVADRANIGPDRVVIERAVGNRLPYADHMIDLLLATNITADQLSRLPIAEVLRVLRPQGVAIIGNGDVPLQDQLRRWADGASAGVKTAEDGFIVIRKPPLQGTSDWPLWEHGPDNNPLSNDQAIKAPYLTQFMAEPLYIGMPAITTVAGGRTFLATGNIAHHRREWKWLNQLIARNGYNGEILWQRSLPDGFLAHRSAYFATDDLFHLMEGNGCTKLDAATGKPLGRIEIPGVEGQWKWMAPVGDILYVMAGEAPDKAQVVLGDRSFGGWSWADLSPGYYARPRVPWGFGRTVAAYDIKANRLLWRHDDDQLIDSRALAISDGRLFLYCPDAHLRSLDCETGKVLWTNSDRDILGMIERPGRGLISTPGFRSACMAVATPEAVVIQGQTRMMVVAVSAKDGSLLWTKKKITNNPNALYVDGHIILGVGPGGSHVALDPKTGEEIRDLRFRKVSCTRLTGCPDSFFVRGEGTLRFDRATGKVLIDGAIRPACNDGVIPANGMLYIGPWPCDCNLSLFGAVALCSAGTTPLDQIAPPNDRLEKAADDLATVAAFEVTDADWPTYRADDQRTGASTVSLARPTGQDKRVPQWTSPPSLSFIPTPPVTAGNLVLIAGDDGRVRAIDAMSGQPAWQFVTAGPIKAPPTVWQGRVFVGSGDGYVYALEAATGRLLWRFQAAPLQRRIMIFGRMCSTWPVNSGVLVRDGIAYFAAGIVDRDGTYVYALDAVTGELRWQNTTCGHLNPELRKGVSAQGNLTIQGDTLLMAGGNQVNPAMFELATGKCLNQPFPQGNPKANHGRFAGVLEDDHPIVGGRVLYATAEYVANKDSFVVLNNGRPTTLNFGGIPPVWNGRAMALVNFQNGKLTCFDQSRVVQQIEQGTGPRRPTDRVGQRWFNVSQALLNDGAAKWQTDLDQSIAFEVLGLAATPDEIVALIQFQDRIRAHPQWQLAAINIADGTAPWFWRHNLPSEPLPEGLAVGRHGQVVVSLLNGTVMSLAPKQPRPAAPRRD